MARRAPTGIHSEFRERMLVTVRAPEGDSMRSELMRRLVAEMGERKKSGHLIEWMVDALLDRVARDIAIEKGLQIQPIKPVLSSAASQPGEGESEAQAEHGVTVLYGRGGKSDVNGNANVESPEQPASNTSGGGLRTLPVGLRAMG